MERLDVTIDKNGVILRGANGKPPRTISHADFLDGFNRVYRNEVSPQEKEDEVSENPFLLPPNAYLFHPGSKYTEIAMFYRERKVPQIKFTGRGGPKTFKNFSLPNIVISVRLKKSQDKRDPKIAFSLHDVRFYATDKGPLGLPPKLVISPNSTDHIWALPLPNMYGEGRMCTGGNSLISTYTKDLRSLHYLYKMIFESAFNSDLSIPSLSSSMECLAWLEKIDAAPSFPYNQLQRFSAEKHKANQAEFTLIQSSSEV